MKSKFFSKFMFVVALVTLLSQASYSQNGFSFANKKNSTTANSFRAEETISIGDASSPWGSYNFPVDFYGKTSVSQSIYTQADINHAPCVITQLEYSYKTVNPEITTNPIEGEEFRVWLCNTTESSLAEEDGWWIPYSEFTLVFEGQLSLETGLDKKMTFTLTTPYVYNGENLCVMVERKLSETAYPNHFDFVASTLGNGDTRARVYWSLDTPIDFDNMIDSSQYHGMTTGTLADVEILVNTETGYNLSGVVTVATTSEALEGAKVEMLNTDLVTYTDAQGNYSFPVLNQGNYTVKVSAFGYITQELALDVNGETTQDFALDILPTATLSGKVVDKDNNPLEGANLVITGYDSYTAVTDATGTFTIADVLFAENYTVVTSKDKYINDTTTFNVADANTVLDDIVLADFLRSPSLVTAVVNANNVDCDVSWVSPYDIVDYRYDGGNCWNGGVHVNGELAVFGNVFREPANLFKATWYRYSNNGNEEGDSVNLFVFPLNDQQQPINQPVFTKKVFSEFNAWTEFRFDEAIELENGFMIALSGQPNALGIGLDDGMTPEYPFIPNVNYVSENYLLDEGGFFPIEAIQPLPGNFMIRAEGYNLNTGGKLANYTDRSLNKYKVYRLLEGTQNDETQWSLLSDNVTELTYTDSDWSTLEANWYRYAVKAVYSDNQESEASFSNLINKGLTTNITIEVTTNTPEVGSVGAKVKLRNEDDDTYTYIKYVSNENGTVVFENIMKGTYTVSIKLDGYTDVFEDGVDFTTEDTYSQTYQLVEALMKPKNLEVVVGDDVVFYWNLTQVITEGFETYGDFEINPTGNDVQWTYLDLDGNATTTFSGIYFPNQGEPSAFMVFTPEATQPSINLVQFPGMAPNSGDSYLMGFGLPNATNNDFIISPKLNFSQDFIFSFFAKSFSITNLPKFQVGYSTTTNSADAFVWLTNSPVSPAGGPTFTEYTYTVPKDAKYVCINNVSEGEVMLMIDDIKIMNSSKAAGRSLVNYKVYLDGNFQAETTELNYMFDMALLTGQTNHEAGVEAVYSTGTSERATIEFSMASANEEIEAENVSIYPVPANSIVKIVGAFDKYYMYDVTGKLIMTGDLDDSQINVGDLENGIYNIQLINNSKVITRQIVVKH